MRQLNFQLFVRLVGWVLLSAMAFEQHAFPSDLRPFTVQDEIGLAHFGDPYSGGIDPTLISPDGAYVAVHTERGLLKEGRVQDEIRIYNLEMLQRFANASSQAGYPEPVWTVIKNTYKHGPLITDWRWMSDSRGIAFLVKTENGGNQIMLGDVVHRKLTALTPVDQDVLLFDVRDAGHYAYTVRSLGPAGEMMAKDPSFDATGLSLFSPLTLPMQDPDTFRNTIRGELWAADGGKPFAVRNSATGAAIPIYGSTESIRLSPDGNSVAALLPLENVSSEWTGRYGPPPEHEIFSGVIAGHQNLNDAVGAYFVSAYATIDLRTGKVSQLTDAPAAISAGWLQFAKLSWSQDGRHLLIPGTFIAGSKDAVPCVAVAAPAEKSIECAQPIRSMREQVIFGAQFESGQSDRIIFDVSENSLPRIQKLFVRSETGIWQSQEMPTVASASAPNVELTVKEGLNDPPVLVATDRSTHKSGVVWDPNPQLKEIRMSDAVAYRWKDDTGKDWVGGLYKPLDYVPGRQYPLVIQTHGFVETLFRPSGVFPTAFAARALAAQGIMVLQVPDCVVEHTPDEGLCHVKGFESAVKQLAAEGLIDTERIGIVGFSRTCYYVMETLTNSSLPIRAASITNGVNQGYLQYLLTTDSDNGLSQADEKSIIGTPPYGPGLQAWLKNSPEFNLDKVTAPLEVVSNNGMDIVFMWEPYAMLRIMKKPVDLVVLNSAEHVLTDPRVRLASQGGTVNWFRFWLQNYEDPDPAKADQYRRWRELRKLQDQNQSTAPTN